MKRASLGAARRYARALLDVALQQGDPAPLRRELEAVASAYAAHPQLHAALTNPALAVEKKKALVAAVFKGETPLLARLLELLASADRLELVPAIAASYAAQLNAHRNVAAAEAVSAVPLEKEQRAALEAALQQATGMGVELKTSVDPALLGGLLVKIGGRHFDGSVRGRLQALRERLSAAQGSA